MLSQIQQDNRQGTTIEGDTMKIAISLPWPPSVNHYWAPRKGGGTRLTDKARAYRDKVMLAVLQKGKERVLTGRLKLTIHAYMPDRRIRDLDNYWKGPLDGMQHARVYENDNQIDDERMIRMPVEKGGRMHVTIEEIQEIER